MSPLLALSGRLLFVPEEERDMHAATLEALIHKCKANVPECIVRNAWGKLPEEREGERLTENTQPQVCTVTLSLERLSVPNNHLDMNCSRPKDANTEPPMGMHTAPRSTERRPHPGLVPAVPTTA